MTTPLETQLEHLVALMAPPYRENWKAFCWAKAVYLAESNPTEYGGLPKALTAAMLESSATTPEPPSKPAP